MFKTSLTAQKYKMKQIHSPLGAGMLGDHLKLKLNVSFSWWVQSNLRSNCVQVVDALLVHDHHPKVGQVQDKPLLNLNSIRKYNELFIQWIFIWSFLFFSQTDDFLMEMKINERRLKPFYRIRPWERGNRFKKILLFGLVLLPPWHTPPWAHRLAGVSCPSGGAWGQNH